MYYLLNNKYHENLINFQSLYEYLRLESDKHDFFI